MRKVLLILTLVILGFTVHASAQWKSHEIGPLWLSMLQTGARPELIGLGDLLTYPGGDFFTQSRKNMDNQGLWIGVKDWTNKFGQFKTFYVSEGGYLNYDAPELLKKISLRKWVRQYLPLVSVNGSTEQRIVDSAASSSRKTDLAADEMITTKWTTDVGVEITRNSYAFANPAFGHFIIQEFVLKNTGNIDTTPNVELNNQNLTGVYFGFWRAFTPSIDFGHSLLGGEFDDWSRYYGNQPGDTLRGFWEVYDGDNFRKTFNDIGDPYEVTGEFLSPQHVSYGVLHADTDHANEGDNRAQPSTVNFWPRQQVRSHTKGDQEQTLYSDISSGVQSRGSDAKGVANAWDPQVQRPDLLMAFGPYDIPFGKDVRIVLFDAVGSVDRKLAIEYGRQWKNGQFSFQGKSGDQAKDAFIATGRDSLHQSVRRAEWVWKNGLAAVPDGPEAPNLNIKAGPGKVELEWYYGNYGFHSSTPTEPDVDTGIQDFSGYRVYRAEESYTNIYTKIFECGGKTGVPVTNTFTDRNVKRGASYFYYVTAFDDGSQNRCELLKGKSTESSWFSNRNYQFGAIPVEGARNEMDSIYVVPNPYHIQGLAYGGTIAEDWNIEPDIGARIEDRLSFVGLPAKAKIRIFTAHGDLVATLDHPNPYNMRSVAESADEMWFQITDSWQTPKSGVYFFTVDGWNLQGQPLGTATGKFVIIR
jgi:hypothetical protein